MSKEGEAAWARSTKSRPEGDSRTFSSSGERVEEGNPRGDTGYSRSPLTRKGARLVVSTLRPGQASIRIAISDAA
jgi:hypothetical protein